MAEETPSGLNDALSVRNYAGPKPPRHIPTLPNLETTLTFLDDRLLPATSHAVERGNRRYRKMQSSIYRVRTGAQIKGRLALDLLRESQAQDRAETSGTLHRARAA